MDGPDFPGALRAMADNIADHLGTLTTRLRQRTGALSRVVAERDAYRKALVAVLELEQQVHEDDIFAGNYLQVAAVHDAIGSDLIMRLTYRPRMILPTPHGGTDWAEWAKNAVLVLPSEGVQMSVVRGLPGEPDYKRVEKLMAEHGRSWEQAFRIALDEEELGQLGDPADWRDATPKTLAGVAEAMTDLADRGWLPVGQAVEDPRSRPFDKVDLGPQLAAADEHIRELVDLASKADPCICTIAFNKHDGSHILDRESTCPVHGGAACKACGSTSPEVRYCTACRGECPSILDRCADRWHEE